MTDPTASDASRKQKNITQISGDWLMAISTLLFVFLYAAAFSGKLDPLKDNAMLTRLEPIIFVIIGYYFGRIPTRQSEKTLQEEITRQTQRADAAQYAKEKAQQERETLEEKMKNARTTLKTLAPAKTDETKPVQNDILKIVGGILDS